MSKSHSLDDDFYGYTEATELISKQEKHAAGHSAKFADEMFKAIRSGDLPSYDYRSGKLLSIPIPFVTPLGVRRDEVNKWLKTTSWGFTWYGQAPAPEPKTPTAEQRQTDRWKACTDAGLQMPTDTYKSYPRGIGAVAKKLGIARQSLKEDLDKHRERLFGGRNGR
jgi:hypothetical protein